MSDLAHRDRDREVARLRDRLADLETERATLAAEIEAFRADYMREVGVVMARVHELEARLLRRAAERSHRRVDAQAAADAEEKARRTTAEAKAVSPPPGPPPTADLKRLFRDAAKRMHPDFARDEATRAHAEAFMKRLNEAYRSGDGDAMIDLLRQWAAAPQPSALPGRGQRDGADLRAAVARAERELLSLRGSELATLMESVMAAAAAGRDLMADMRAEANAALARARARLAELG